MSELDTIQYQNDPIVEVICEFRFVPSEAWDLTIPGLLYDKVKTDFPKKGMLRAFESKIGAGDDSVQQQISLSERTQFLQEDEKAFIQVGPDLLAVNHLKPYPTWEKFLPLISNAFENYLEVAHPRGLQRIGLRYINRIQFEMDSIELEDYFAFRPEHPFMPQLVLGSFVVGLHAAYEGERDLLKIQLTSARPDPPYSLAAILDLDYYLAEPEAISLDEALAWIDTTAHAHIQRAFEDCLTPELKTAFGPR